MAGTIADHIAAAEEQQGNAEGGSSWHRNCDARVDVVMALDNDNRAVFGFDEKAKLAAHWAAPTPGSSCRCPGTFQSAALSNSAPIYTAW